MDHERSLPDTVRSIIDENMYLTLGTASADGTPWVSPVYFATDGYVDFYWMSSPEVQHSRNLAKRPEVSMVVFTSTAPPGCGRPVYLAGTAEQVPRPDLDHALSVYNGRFDDPAERGLRVVELADVQPPADYRLYRARVTEHSILCPRRSGQPCAEHGRMHDHRLRVPL